MNKQQQSRRGTPLVSIQVNGVSMRIDPASIGKSHRKVHHGEFKGTQVNSPATFAVGDSVILWPDADKSTVTTIGKAELGVLATSFLRDEGFDISLAAPRR